MKRKKRGIEIERGERDRKKEEEKGKFRKNKGNFTKPQKNQLDIRSNNY